MKNFPSALIDGYRSFRETRLAADAARYRRLAERGQRPQVMIIGCCDSRAAPETIFDAAPGELFVHRNVANLVPPHEAAGGYHGTSAAIEFGVRELRVRHLVVMGHGLCGGITAFLSGSSKGGDFIGQWISLMEPATKFVAEDVSEAAGRQRAMEFATVRQSLANLRTFPFVNQRLADDVLSLHGAWFGIATGELLVLDQASNAFVPVAAA
jgi:carbonic anhydrase